MKLKIEIPAELSAITLRQYQEYLKVLKINEDSKDSEFMDLKILSIFCGLSMKKAYKLPLSEFSSIVTHIKSLFNEETPLQRDVTLYDSKGSSVTFGFIPRLEDMTMGEFVDLDNSISDWQKMHKALAVLYRPITYKMGDLYQIEEYESASKYEEYMLDMPVNVAIGAVVFFYRLGKELSNYTVTSLLQQAKEDTQFQEALQTSGVGISHFTHSLKVMSENLMKFQDYLPHSV